MQLDILLDLGSQDSGDVQPSVVIQILLDLFGQLHGLLLVFNGLSHALLGLGDGVFVLHLEKDLSDDLLKVVGVLTALAFEEESVAQVHRDRLHVLRAAVGSRF